MTEVLKWVGTVGAIWLTASFLIAAAWWLASRHLNRHVRKPGDR